MFCLLAVIVFFDSILAIILGVLTSGGDTKYPFIVDQVCQWGFVLVPTFFLFYTKQLTSATVPYYFMLLWLTVTLFFVYRRYKSLEWYHSLI
ncbi:hypothetical protein AGMMS49949_05310 [Alphaproteobacteria bacterium]|nr:hypothetical protein AGMMS49949_05310 [Alphaproteobacteria bacterium]